MKDDSKGRELFIVDNSVSGWTGLRYLEEWTGIATAFDIATGYFEIGALLALDGKWQELDKIRILMGSETTFRTRQLVRKAVENQTRLKLEESLNDEKRPNPFLRGVASILDALSSGKIECRVYDKEKFHAKAYITHAKLEVVGAQALIGSSNFTRPGLTENIELNVQVQSAREVAQFQDWFETHWNEAVQLTDAVVRTVSRHMQLYSPFDVYAQALYQYFQGHELTATEWDETKSRMFPILDRYQKEAYWALMKIAQQHSGAFLCDGVGLGKTFVGLMLIERMILHEGKRVVLFAPKATKEGVWEPHLRRWLPHIGGFGGGADFSNLAVFNHTDLGRKGNFVERFKRIAELADVVIIDEAHHFRNPGRQGDEENGIQPSRYYRLFELLDSTTRPKSVFMLTATPINNRISDFRHMMELFTRRDESYFLHTIGVNNVRAHFNQMESALRSQVGQEHVIASEQLARAQEILSTDEIFRELVVQRSRAYAHESQIQEHGEAAVFPTREDPQVAIYSIRKAYSRMLDLIERAFAKENPLFTLPMYYPLHWYRGSDTDIDPFEENRQRQVVGLIRTNFLKRFESSIAAFELSCARLLEKLISFLETHSQTESEKKRLSRWKAQNSDILKFVQQRKKEFRRDESDETHEEDVESDESAEAINRLDPRDYDVAEMMSETFLDLDQIMQFLDEVRKIETKQDDKLQTLIQIINSKEFLEQKFVIFTEFADTARYLFRKLYEADVRDIEQVDSATTRNRTDVIQCFSPYYNDVSSRDLIKQNRSEIRILISTDVLSEGLNLQDATYIINYDIHWNPVRLMQRIGRVDRRLNPQLEKLLIDDHPEVARSRGRVKFWNFLPPDELNALLSLYTKVTQKTLLISNTLGIEGKKLLTPDDNYDALKEFNHAYEGARTSMEEILLEYQSLIQVDPELEARLKNLPTAIFSGQNRLPRGVRGIFFCYALPALDRSTNEFSETAGTTRWYLFDFSSSQIIDEPSEIISSIRSTPSTQRQCIVDEKILLSVRTKVEKYIKNTYLKRLDAPIGVSPRLCSWMELEQN